MSARACPAQAAAARAAATDARAACSRHAAALAVFAPAVLALAGCAPAPPPGYPGYVEAEYVRVSAPLAGTLARLAVQRGQQVAADAPLFALESESERAARAEAQAQVARAEASLADLTKGRRPPEVAAARAQLAQAQAALRQSESELARTEKLVADRFLPRQRLDDARAARDRDAARVRELTAQVQVTQLPARPDTIEAAQAALKAANDALAQAQWRLDQKTQHAPVAGLVDDTLYRPGEWVAAGAPVVSLRPPGNVKVRFFVPEPVLSKLRVGAPIAVRCDGCGSDIAARITFISPQAEYTPPVIYSRENRAKLVFLVEARPEPADPRLHPGLPVAVVSIGAGTTTP
jgi:HlyD family secretion protein